MDNAPVDGASLWSRNVPVAASRPRKLLLRCQLSLGDVVMLTAAVRDLHRCYPGRFLTDVYTSCPEVWESNPYITPLDIRAGDLERIDCEYPLINRSNTETCHALRGFVDFLNDCLGLKIQLTEVKGDVHLSDEEKLLPHPIATLAGNAMPYWLVVSGGKYDITTKWWGAERFQEVIDRFRGRILFVQVGQAGHYQPRLNGVVDLRGRTTIRQLIRWVFHADGVLCGVTSLMHLAAAVEARAGAPKSRACVVIGGGREPLHWAAYPSHQYLHTLGALPCCSTGGCWKSWTLPLAPTSVAKETEKLCLSVVGERPRCMDMIQVSDVSRRIRLYFEGGQARYLTPVQARFAQRAIVRTRDNPFDHTTLNFGTARRAAQMFIARIPPPHRQFAGRGIVICGGGFTYFVNSWVCIRMLRRLGCRLPIQLWFLGPAEMDQRMRSLLRPFGVECVDALRVRRREPVRLLNGWALKPYAILHCRFNEVLLIDADNVPVRNPEFLFHTAEFRTSGAVFWPDDSSDDLSAAQWLCGVSFKPEPAIESGQILVNKRRCWDPLRLALWYNEHGEFFYQFFHGDKESFHLAFRKLGHPFAMPRKPMRRLPGTMCQFDFAGRLLFQHRNAAKWELYGKNMRITGFRRERECLAYLKELARRWDGRLTGLQ